MPLTTYSDVKKDSHPNPVLLLDRRHTRIVNKATMKPCPGRPWQGSARFNVKSRGTLIKKSAGQLSSNALDWRLGVVGDVIVAVVSLVSVVEDAHISMPSHRRNILLPHRNSDPILRSHLKLRCVKSGQLYQLLTIQPRLDKVKSSVGQVAAVSGSETRNKTADL